MNTPTTPHSVCLDHLGEFLAGELSGEALSQFNAHAAECADCAQTIDEVRQLENTMNESLSGLSPDAGFEDRLLGGIRAQVLGGRRWDGVRRAVTATAAAMVLGMTGVVGVGLMEQGSLPFAFPGMQKASSELALRSPVLMVPAAKESSPESEVSLSIDGSAVIGKQLHDFYSSDKNKNGYVSVGGSAPRGDETYRYKLGRGLQEQENRSRGGAPAIEAPAEARMSGGGGSGPGGPTGSVTPTDSNDSVLLPTDDADPKPRKPGAPEPAPLPAIAAAGAPVTPTPPAPEILERKIVRTATANYEVEKFDAAASVVARVTATAGGFLSSSNSQKLPNGKVRGTIILRLPPGRLDLVMADLRSIGELKSQNVESSDVTRQFVDSQSQLRAARAVEDRLVELIKNGKGQIKDLLAVEKELGEWRTRIERLEGELRYLSNQVALSTLTLTLTEKDIATPATAVLTEALSATLEAADVAVARDRASAAVLVAGGRVIESELRQATIDRQPVVLARLVAEIPQDATPKLLESLGGMGVVSNLNIERRQSTQGTPSAETKIEKKLSRITLSLLTPDAMQPKRTTNVDIAVADVAAAMQTLRNTLESVEGRLTSVATSEDPDVQRASARLRIELPENRSDEALQKVRSLGQALGVSVSEAAGDASNISARKHAIVLVLTPAVSLPPRTVTQVAVQLRSPEEVAAATARLETVLAAAGARVLESKGETSGVESASRLLVVELPASSADTVLTAARSAGRVLSENSSQNASAPTGPMARARIQLNLTTTPQLVPEDRGLWSTVRSALSTGLLGLLWSLQMVLVGVCLLLPWVGIGYLVWRLSRKRRLTPAA